MHIQIRLCYKIPPLFHDERVVSSSTSFIAKSGLGPDMSRILEYQNTKLDLGQLCAYVSRESHSSEDTPTKYCQTTVGMDCEWTDAIKD